MSDLDHSERTRLAYRRLVRERGPEAGRSVDHLKAASLSGAGDDLLRRYEAGALTNVVELSLRDSDHGVLQFMYDLSAFDGADGYGG